MYAIVDIAGQQFKVQKTQKLYVHRLEGEAGSEVSFDRVFLIEDEGKITIGNPVIKDTAVSAKVLEHVKGDKVLVFKKKRRKGYRKLNGHRQYLTQIEITAIGEKVASKPATKASAEKKEAAPEIAASSAAKKPVAEKKIAAPKAASAKPAAEKKASAKPVAEKKAAPKKASAKPVAEKKAAAKKAAPKTTTAAKKPVAKKTDAAKKTSDKK